MDEKKNIGSLFDRIAARYDLLNHLLSLNIDRRWRRLSVAGIRPIARNAQALDVAVGTADLALELVRQGKTDHVQGLDLSRQMMRIGELKVQRAGMANQICFTEGSALDMPFEDKQFDLVTCAYGVRNFADLDRGMSEMLRVLKTNGQLMILEFSYPSNHLIAWLYDLYFSYILPWVGRLVSKDRTAYTYLNRSVKHFVWGEQMCQRLRQAGFRHVRHRPLTFGITTVYYAVR